MNMKNFLERAAKYPLGALYCTLPGIIAFFAAVPMFASGAWDAALVDLLMAGILITSMLKKILSTSHVKSTAMEKTSAWICVISANILVLLPFHTFQGSLSTAFAFSLLIFAFVLYFSGSKVASICIAPTLWCCVFMPYHEEFMLFLSFPLRLSATMLSAGILKLCGIGVIYSGTSISLPDLDIAITDACSGINQLDAFILIAFIAVQLLHKRTGWKILHFAFIIPAIITGNSLRIVVTVLLSKLLGETVLNDSWHIALGYVQIILALLIFFAVGRILRIEPEKKAEDEL